MAITLESLWSQAKERLQIALTRPTFETWIEPASAMKMTSNCLVISTPNFARNWLQKYYLKTIADVVQEIWGQPVEIQIVVAADDGAAPSHHRI